jgi:co-chaperonin GroES (HSP10)
MKAYKGFVLVKRAKVAETTSGIILTNNNAETRALKAELVDKMTDQLDGIAIGDTVYVDKTKSLDIEGEPELFFVPEEFVCGRITK